MGFLQRPRMSAALTACAVGVGLCAVTFAVAGPTPGKAPDPLEPLPADVARVRPDSVVQCNSASGGPNVPGGYCYRLITIKPLKEESPAQLVDRVAQHYQAKGMTLVRDPTQPLSHTYGGLARPCGPYVAITNDLATLSNALNTGAAMPGGPAPAPVPGVGGDPAGGVGTPSVDPSAGVASSTSLPLAGSRGFAAGPTTTPGAPAGPPSTTPASAGTPGPAAGAPAPGGAGTAEPGATGGATGDPTASVPPNGEPNGEVVDPATQFSPTAEISILVVDNGSFPTEC